MKAIITAVHAAAGNQKGIEASQKFSLQPRPPKGSPAGRENKATDVNRFFGGEPAFTQEQIRAAAAARKAQG